jgi:glycosyltransferase involved in cell wall biosynthesis
MDENTFPFVSVLTPTFNRRKWIPQAIHCFKHQTYPAHRMEWIILDDSSDASLDASVPLKEAGMLEDPRVRYIRLPLKMSIGVKRTMLGKLAKGPILSNFDDDDYIPAERISHHIRLLRAQPSIKIVGSSEMYLYFTSDGKITKAGPFGQFHATAGTWTFQKKLLEECSFDPHSEKAEEGHFLKKFSIPMIQADPMKTLLVICHDSNTVDKSRLRENSVSYSEFKEGKTKPGGTVMQETSMTLKQFIGKKDKWELDWLRASQNAS